MQITLYRACIDYFKSTDLRDQNQAYRYFSDTNTNEEAMRITLKENMPSMFMKCTSMFPDKDFDIVQIGKAYYIKEHNKIQGFVAVGAVYPVYKIGTGHYSYKYFTVNKYGSMFIVRDFNGKALKTLIPDKESEDEVLSRAFDIIDDYANNRVYLRDNKFNDFMMKGKHK